MRRIRTSCRTRAGKAAAVTLHAQYAPDGDHLHRITLTPPDPGEQRVA
jgi:hypothetical protein